MVNLVLWVASVNNLAQMICFHTANYPVQESQILNSTSIDNDNTQESMPTKSLCKRSAKDAFNVLKKSLVHPHLAQDNCSEPYEDLIVKGIVLGLPMIHPEDYLPSLFQQVERGNNLTIIDVGANTGMTAIPLAKMGHRIISFEPGPTTCKELQRNVAIKKVAQLVEVHCVAIGAKEETAIFDVSAKASQSFHVVQNSSKATPAGSTVAVSIKPLHNFVNSAFLLKTDTQGFEYSVLEGSLELLKHKAIKFLVVEFSLGLLKAANTPPEKLLRLIYDAGYVCTHLGVHTQVNPPPNTKYALVEPHGAMATSRPPTMTFSEFVESLKNHPSSSSNARNCWTDLLCTA